MFEMKQSSLKIKSSATISSAPGSHIKEEENNEPEILTMTGFVKIQKLFIKKCQDLLFLTHLKVEFE